MSVFTGKAYWASVQQPNTTYEPQWCIDVVIDEKTAEVLQAEGLKVKRDEEKGLVIKVKRNVTRKDGEENPKPRVLDANKGVFTELIGNGSLVNVQYRPYVWEYAGKKGVNADLVGVQVLELIPYIGEGRDEFEVVSTDGQPEDELPSAQPVNEVFDEDITDEETPFVL